MVYGVGSKRGSKRIDAGMKDFSRYDIAQIIADEFELINSDIQPDDRLDSLTDDFDVTDRMRLCRKLETTFDVDIPWEDEFVTVRDVYEYMEAKAVTNAA